MPLTWEELDKADPADILLLDPKLGNEFPPVALDSSITIGIAAYGNIDTTIFALRSLLASVSGSYELILVDDASPDETGKLFELVPSIHPNTRVFRFPENIEYSGSLNTILSHASGDRIVFLSNDIFVSPAYIAELLNVSNIYKDSGILRGCSNFVDNQLITHNIKDCCELNNFADLFHYAQKRSKNHAGTWLDDQFLTGDAFLVTRKLLETVGYLDPRFFGYFADHDLGVRARQAGFRPRLALGAFAWHQTRSNFDYLTAEKKQEKLDKRWARINQNWAVFKQKYNLPVSMPYEGIRRIPWDGLGQLPLSDSFPPCNKSAFCLPNPNTVTWLQYRASSLAGQARIKMYGGELRIAESLCADALKLAPNSSDLLTVLGMVQTYQGKHAAAIKTFRRAIKLDSSNSKAHSNLLMCMNYYEEYTQQEIFRESKKWGKLHGTSNSGIVPHRTAKSRIRIAYISPDFRHHSVCYFFLPLLENHDRSRFEIYCLSDTKNSDDTTRQMIALADGWRDISLLTNNEAEKIIREVAPDILVDLAGHTGHTIRLGLFCKRLAPVQITWLGYPNTTGLVSMDYRITDAIADPHGVLDTLHTEKLIRLSDCFVCYKPAEDAPDVAPLPAFKNGYLTFGSFNMLPKIQDRTIEAWSEIMHQTIGSKMILKNHYLRDDTTVARLLERFKTYGINEERLIMKTSDPDTASHLAQYSTIDISLDTFPYNGTTTTCEALWMGVPVITLTGDRHAGRVGTSLLTAIGLSHFTAYSITEYIEKAVSISSDLAKLSELRSSLRSTMKTSSLCSASMFANKFESSVTNSLNA